MKLNRLNEELMFFVLLFLFYLVERVHGKEGDPLHVEAGDDLVGHGRLAARAAAADPNDQRFDKFLSFNKSYQFINHNVIENFRF